MTGKELVTYFEKFAPKGAASQYDNVGLQVGSLSRRITNIFLTLELDEKGLMQAIEKKCNFILTHHPLLFRPIKNINIDSDAKSQMIAELLQNKITVYSAHTNFDHTKGGVSFELARILGLQNVGFLANEESNQFKLVVFVPAGDVDRVAGSIFKAGGGVIGEYSNCSYRLDGTGTFIGSKNSNPKVGRKQKFETVVETRIEVLVHKWNLNAVISAMLIAHPYEEPAYDVYPVANKNVNFGSGAIGELKNRMTSNMFLQHVCKSLKAKSVRYCSGKSNFIKRVAVCGGNGVEYTETAISKGADAFVTADAKYHKFQGAENKIMLIDAGHYETEVHSMKTIKKHVDAFIKEKKGKVKIYLNNRSTNPVKFYNK